MHNLFSGSAECNQLEATCYLLGDLLEYLRCLLVLNQVRLSITYGTQIPLHTIIERISIPDTDLRSVLWLRLNWKLSSSLYTYYFLKVFDLALVVWSYARSSLF